MVTVAEIATLAHGYTMDDVDRMAGLAVSNTVAKVSHLDWDERRSSGWHAIVELLYCSHNKPTARDLVAAGERAILRANEAERRHHGLSKRNPGQLAPRYLMFWSVDQPSDRPARMIRANGPHVDADFTDRIVDRMALPTALGELTDVQYEALAALAAHDDRERAAAALGISVVTFNRRLKSARRRFLAEWFAPETPRSLSRSEDARTDPEGTCKSGHSRVEWGIRTPSGRLRCRLCQRNVTRRRRARIRGTLAEAS